MMKVENVKMYKTADEGATASSANHFFEGVRKYFWSLFILNFAGIMIAKYVAVIFGGWFLSGEILLYMKIAILLFYNRKKSELLEESCIN